MSDGIPHYDADNIARSAIENALGDDYGGGYNSIIAAINDIVDRRITQATEVTVGIRLFRDGAKLPTRGTEYSAGWDIYAYINEEMSDFTTSGMVREEDGEHVLYAKDIYGCNIEIVLTPEQLEYVRESMSKQITIPPGEMRNIKTGINFRIPEGYEVQIRPRSGLAFKNQVTIMNSPGTIDADYDGDGEKFELNMMVVNHGQKPVVIEHGMRIGQMIVAKLVDLTLTEVSGDNQNRLQSQRDGGLGHTGTK
jgi:dUTP pyrophosphatase